MPKNLFNLAILSLAVGMYYLVINPLYTGIGLIWSPSQGIKSLRELNIQYDDALSQAAALYSQAQVLETEYASIDEAAKSKIGVMVPYEIDPVRLLDEVTQIGIKNNIALTRLSYTQDESFKAPGVNSGAQGAYTLTFSVTTTYSKFKELMHSFETSLRLFTIKRVKLDAGSNDNNLMDFTVEVETYYLQ